jgi:hypothetical protein
MDVLTDNTPFLNTETVSRRRLKHGEPWILLS